MSFRKIVPAQHKAAPKRPAHKPAPTPRRKRPRR